MTDWIADGEAGSAVRAKLNALMIPISSVSVSSPVEYVDIALPAGYASFICYVTNFELSSDVAFDFAAVAFSANGGVSFYCDPDNSDTYGYVQVQQTTSAGPLRSSDTDSLGYLTSGRQGASDYQLQIFPGNATKSPRLFSQRVADQWTNFTGFQFDSTFTYLNPEATLPPTYARMNLMRLLPYGSGDVDPPTSGNTLTANLISLFGIPA